MPRAASIASDRTRPRPDRLLRTIPERPGDPTRVTPDSPRLKHAVGPSGIEAQRLKHINNSLAAITGPEQNVTHRQSGSPAQRRGLRVRLHRIDRVVDVGDVTRPHRLCHVVPPVKPVPV
jgi:hypothetical protein